MFHCGISFTFTTFRNSAAEAFSRKKDAEQDAAKQALLHLQKIKARRPQARSKFHFCNANLSQIFFFSRCDFVIRQEREEDLKAMLES